MAESIEQIKVNTSGLQEKEDLLKHYQNSLSEYDKKDDILQKLITQYSAMESALANFEKY